MVSRIKDEEKKIGSIVVAGMTEDGVAKGRVIAVGPGGLDFQGNRVPLEVRVDDVVVYASFRGTDVRDTDSTAYTVLEEGDIIAVLV